MPPRSPPRRGSAPYRSRRPPRWPAAAGRRSAAEPCPRRPDAAHGDRHHVPGGQEHASAARLPGRALGRRCRARAGH
jgi:hypothetical protein